MTVIIRPACADDAEQIVPLIRLLGHQVTADGIARRIEAPAAAGCPQLVAIQAGRVVGLCGLHLMTPIHREQSVGRITILVVAEDARGNGIGRMLVSAAEAELRDRGSGIVEVTSNDRLVAAHRFYRRLGYEATSTRFAKNIL